MRLGRIQQFCDVIGKKYLLGSRDPIAVFSTRYRQEFEMHQIWRVLSATVNEAVDRLGRFWVAHPIPQVMGIDNAMTFRGSPHHPGGGSSCDQLRSCDRSSAR